MGRDLRGRIEPSEPQTEINGALLRHFRDKMDDADDEFHDAHESLVAIPQHDMVRQRPSPSIEESGIHAMNTRTSSVMSTAMTASHPSLLHLSTSENSLKHLKLGRSLSPSQSPPPIQSDPPRASANPPRIEEKTDATDVKTLKTSSANDSSGMVSPDETAGSQSASSLSELPLKATTFLHLSKKYLKELEYMLVEFEKLEKQLLGAKTLASQESAGSRERREKLHSFILHLRETITQIRTGCELEAAGKSTVGEPLKSTGLAQPSKEKEEEENVQKLEEHILANLLPVKVRLKKQLAAQKGAKHNPAGMPVRGVADAPNREEKDESRAFLAANQQPGPQFGKPLDGGGSSLTQKLHGSTLGSQRRIHGNGVGQDENSTATSEERKVLYAGMALGSEQMESSVSAASSAHRFVLQSKALLELSGRKRSFDTSANDNGLLSADGVDKNCSTSQSPSVSQPSQVVSAKAGSVVDGIVDAEVERYRLRKKRRKKKRMSRDKQQSQLQQRSSKRRKSLVAGGKSRGPRSVEYMCALCNEIYSSTCDYNPWWALTQHDCPKCHKQQIPRVDISAPANAIEYHPALLAHADDNGASNPAGEIMPPSQVKGNFSIGGGPISETDESDLSDEDMSDDTLGSDESDLEVLASMSPAEQAEYERFGAEYKGPVLDEKSSSKLLVLMLHASKCPCRHKSPEHRDVCRSVKWMMMHVRDCPGTTASFDVCPFPWCRKVKHLLYHLVSCPEPDLCEICSPSEVSHNINALRALNDFRLQKCREVPEKKQKKGARNKTASSRSKSAKSSTGSSSSSKNPSKAGRSIETKGTDEPNPNTESTPVAISKPAGGQRPPSQAADIVDSSLDELKPSRIKKEDPENAVSEEGDLV